MSDAPDTPATPPPGGPAAPPAAATTSRPATAPGAIEPRWVVPPKPVTWQNMR